MGKKKVKVIISTYNGEKNIVKQLDSIFEQKGVEVSVHIRDDNSTDGTINIINQYKKQHLEYSIVVQQGENKGYAKSFIEALGNAGDVDYYAFSDQDDIWKSDKLIKTIKPMEKDSYIGPKLAYCKMQRSDKLLRRLDEQIEVLTPSQLTKKIVLTKTFNYGAATVINKEAKNLVCRCWPEVDDLPHDMWAGLLCYWFGKVYYIDEELYYWIRYDTSVTGEGTKKSGRAYRIKKCLSGKSYPNVAKELLSYYQELLTKEDIVFLQRICNYKKNFKDWIALLFDLKFRRDSTIGTVILKLGIFLKWY